MLLPVRKMLLTEDEMLLTTTEVLDFTERESSLAILCFYYLLDWDGKPIPRATLAFWCVQP